MNILYVDPLVSSGTSSNYKYYDGVYDELCKLCNVELHRGIPNNLSSKDIDLILFGLGWFEHKYFGKIEGIDNYKKMSILFKPQNNLREKLKFCKFNAVDKILTPVPDFEIYEQVTKIDTALFPYGFSPETFFDRKINKNIDIGFSGALHENKHYPSGAFPVPNIRTNIGKLLEFRKDLNVFWSSKDGSPARIPSYEEYAKKINSSKIWIATQAAFGDITPRYYEVAASGALLFCQKVPKQYEHIFIDGVNCVQFENDLSDFEEKLDYYLQNELKRQEICKNAKNSFLEIHTWKKRCEYILREAKRLNGK